MDNETEKVTATNELTDEERVAIKYMFLREKIIYNFNKGNRILKISKIVTAVIFLLFTFIGITVSQRTGHQLQWLQAWIILIFINITIFVIADYSKYLIESRVIPYLEDDEQVEFGEYDIFIEDIDNPDDDDEEEEEEEEEEE